jgi:membrane dipeptidase
VDAAVFSVSVHQGPRTAEAFAAARVEAQAQLDAIKSIAETHPGRAGLALSADDVRRLRAERRIAVIIGFLNAYPLGTDFANFQPFYDAGVRVFGFTHAGGNDFADSSRPLTEPREEHGGLAPRALEAIAELNRLGVLIDVSQLTPAGLLQVTERTSAPVAATHSAIRALVDTGRNLNDVELDAIKSTGGVVQVVAFNYYLAARPADFKVNVAAIRERFGLSAAFEEPTDGAFGLGQDVVAFIGEINRLLPTASVVDLINAVEYAAGRIGIDHVGLSSDFNHGGGVEGWRHAEQALNVTTELVRRGYGQPDIAKLWGENFLRVLAKAQASASAGAVAA